MNILMFDNLQGVLYMNKSIKAILTVCAILTLSGCGGPDKPTPINSTVNVIDKVIKKGVLPELDISDDIAGLDADNNGIRDDIDIYINSLPITLSKKKLLSEHARHVQLSITVEPNTRANEEEFARNLVLSYICYIRAFDSSEKDDARDYRKNIQSFTANTYERAKRLHQYDLSRNGSVISLPPADACTQ